MVPQSELDPCYLAVADRDCKRVLAGEQRVDLRMVDWAMAIRAVPAGVCTCLDAASQAQKRFEQVAVRDDQHDQRDQLPSSVHLPSFAGGLDPAEFALEVDARHRWNCRDLVDHPPVLSVERQGASPGKLLEYVA